jgi:hypothetical protein
MMIAPLVLEGTWEEIAARAEELRGCRLRVQVLTPEQESAGQEQKTESSKPQDRKYTPNPIILTDEGPAIFDVYRSGPGEPVKCREGGKRLPSIVLELAGDEADEESVRV